MLHRHQLPRKGTDPRDSTLEDVYKRQLYMRVWLWGHDRKTGDEMYFSTAGERLLQELKLMEALPEEPQRIKSALAVAEKLTLGLRNHYEANWHPHPAPGRLMKAPIAYAGSRLLSSM